MPIQAQPIPLVLSIPGIGLSRRLRIIPQAPNRQGGLGVFSEFYFQANGSNVNSGTDNNAAAKYTSTNGNWASPTFIPTDGSNPVAAGVQVGDFVSIYIDAATVGVYIARITNVVNGPNGAITISTVFATGTAPTTSATTRSVKVGGAMQTPFNASGFPLLSNDMSVLRNLNNDRVRINFKNDQTYSTGGGNSWNGITQVTVQGYTNVPGDGGKALWTSSATGSGGFLLGTHSTWIDMIFQNTGAINSNDLIALSSAATFIRCVFRGAMGSLMACSASGVMCVDCEFYNWNRGNNSNKWAVSTAAPSFILGCYFHDCTAAGTPTTQGAILVGHSYISNCIFQRITGTGLLAQGATGSYPNPLISNCDFYSVLSDCILFNSGTFSDLVIRNCNFVKCGRGVNIASTFIGSAILNSNGYGTGSMANQNRDILVSSIEVGKILYSANVSPWNAPDTGDFTLVAPAAISAGYSLFTEVDGTNLGTIGYPDISAAQAPSTSTTITIDEGIGAVGGG